MNKNPENNKKKRKCYLNSKNTKKILNKLEKAYPDAHCELNYRNPFELLIAVILSAQATDQKVNLATKNLFAEYPDPQSFLKLASSQLEDKIRSIGLYKNKAKNILETCRILINQYHSTVPNKYEDLIRLPGVGRKTANVVLAVAFNIPAFPVDTHVLRVANRLGLASGQKTDIVEEQLKQVVPQKYWIDFHHRLIWHGRRLCKARNPLCSDCPLEPDCPSAKLYSS